MLPAREPVPTAGPGLIAFRGLERVVALLALPLLSPLLGLIWVWIKLDSRGPALVRETRLGLKREPFEMFVFRTTESVTVELRAYGRRPKGMTEEKARVTRAGSILRRLGFDDLPQLWNVVRGDMALVGPRPVRPEQRRAMPPWADSRFAVKPGLTGLARVKGRHTLGWIDQLRLDRAFVQSDSARLRASILVRTVGAFFRPRKAVGKPGKGWRAYLPKDE